MTGRAVGVDVGGTKAAAIQVDAAGAVGQRAIVDTPADDVPALLAAMRAVTTEVLASDVVAIGVGAAGLVETGTGRIRYAPNIAWREVDLREALGGFGVPVAIDNDCTVAAFGEHAVGAGRGVEDFLYVGVGTGIGGGIVHGGAVMRGAHGFAGEIGHIIVEPGGEVCGCGNRGCWETVASGAALTRASAANGSGAAHDGRRSSRRLATATPRRGRCSTRWEPGSARGSRASSTCSIPSS